MIFVLGLALIFIFIAQNEDVENFDEEFRRYINPEEQYISEDELEFVLFSKMKRSREYIDNEIKKRQQGEGMQNALINEVILNSRCNISELSF
ncbi:MAG: hypothetical protein LBG48_01700 [Rickettsiales bacterium]|jgi:hypothetical protein|nr:hypothetical protein [Rickettsiales bacterium]